ncbi:class I SAM-dependent methyltransferase [Nocardia alni]|uniref:class I SAM-dependent methyltransferase n=1 Tax=Nocardia alni TaxID=2815723 RepID=UPI001C230D18|nr:class I SAM-dependent methyltransferase [Nocardia alni]
MPLDFLVGLVKQAADWGLPISGASDPAELQYLAKLAAEPHVRFIAEIGFNAGFSTYAFLTANPTAMVCSFDIAEHVYVSTAKQHIDEIFPGRHVLVAGNSLATVPTFRKINPHLTFDLIFIDGGHTYEIATGDLANMREFAGPDTILVMDDIAPWLEWGVGPTQAWTQAVAEGMVVQEELIKDGVAVTTIEPPGRRSWVMGRYARDDG